MKNKGKPNRLIHAKSPYLLQHAYNPVDWYEWGDEAFEKAKKENKPVFLSAGYSACYWCHNMARESFEDEEIAEIMNREFVAVKVDREERPDIDSLYMKVCQAMTGRGGWPLTIIMTPEKVPFFAGMYFPKERKYNMPGLKEILLKISQIWMHNREKLQEQGKDLLQALKGWEEGGQAEPGVLVVDTLKTAAEALKSQYDSTYGGLGGAPKFPMPHVYSFLLRWWERIGDKETLDMACHSLDCIQRGGIMDHLGYGFHRYSVDEKWLVPHFEKMLYDQALLSRAYLEAYLATGIKSFEDTAHKTFTYVLGELEAPEGGFYSAENAESEGVEGKYYLWTRREILDRLGTETGGLIAAYFGVSDEGNFEKGTNVLHVPQPETRFISEHNLQTRQWHFLLEESRQIMLKARLERERPSMDDKILVSWNGLMIGSLAAGARALKTDIYARQACKAADFILTKMRLEDGTLLHRYREGEAAIPGFLEDYAFLVAGLLELFETVHEADYLKQALALNEKMLALFWDQDRGGLYFTPADDDDLPVRTREAFDGAIPSGNSVAAQNLLKIAHYTADEGMVAKANGLMDSFSSLLKQNPANFTAMLSALDMAIGPVQQVVLAGDRHDPATIKMIQAVSQHFMPRRVFMLRDEESAPVLDTISPYLADKKPLEGKPAIYVCRDYACQAPVTDLNDLAYLFRQAAGNGPAK